MPFDLKSIAEANPAELYTINFSNEDFSNSHELGKLETALNSFQKLKFKLAEDIISKNKTTFIDFTIKLLDSNRKLKEFDLSDNEFAVEDLPSKTPPQNARRKEASRGGRAPRRIHYATDSTTFDDLLAKLLSSSSLKSLALQNNLLFSKESKLVNVCGAIKKGYQKIDLSNTYFSADAQKKCFTLKQLFTLVEALKTAKSQCQIIISFNELPLVLQTIIPKADSVNLTKSADIIYDLYRNKRFNSTINSSNNVINFESPLDRLTDEETQKLGEALHNSECSISKLILPLCNFSLLTPLIKNHPSLMTINISKLGFGAEISDSLSEIFSGNSKIERLICDYRIFLEPHSKKIIDSILKNSLSSLQSLEANDHKYIELIDSDRKLPSNPKTLMDLINNIKKYPPSIKVIIDLSILCYELQEQLGNKTLLPFPNSADMRIQYSSDEEEERGKPLLFVGNNNKFILTPCYDTHTKVMNHVVAYLEEELEEQMAKAGEEAENALKQQADVEAEQINESKQESQQTVNDVPETTSSTSATSSTSHIPTANHSVSENISLSAPSLNTDKNDNHHDRNSIIIKKNDPALEIKLVDPNEKPLDSNHHSLAEENKLPDLKFPPNLCITLSSELKDSLQALSSLLEKNTAENKAIATATQTLLNDTLSQFVKTSDGSSNSPSQIDENKIITAIATYRENVANLSTNQKIVIAASTFLGILVGFIVGVLAGSLGLNPVSALTGGVTGAVVGAGLGGGIAFCLSRFGVFKYDPIKVHTRKLVDDIENTVKIRIPMTK